jgi:cytochrome c oxidase subunit 4
MTEITDPMEHPPAQAAGPEPDTDLPVAPVPGVTPHGHPTEGQYVIVALVLAVVTACEVAVYYITAIPKHALTAMLLIMSAIKFSLVVLWFMHLRFDSRIFRRLFVTGLVLAVAVVLIYLTTLHFYTPDRIG